MPCPYCQAVTPPGGRFCGQCGVQLPAEGSAARTTRRQMTVLFCDLAGSTELARCVDPDDLLVALQTYQDAVRKITARYGGFVARIVGDGVDVYFGYPLANEDDAALALHTALALLAEVQRIEVVPGVTLALRIGLATGIVVVGVGQGILAGTTPNLAARIQACIPVGSIGVAPGTRRIAGAQFVFDAFGAHALKGFDIPIAISLVRGARSLDSRSAWRGRDASLPMLGRDAELAALLTHWRRSAAGRIGAALVTAEPGLGKSRLVTALDHAMPAQGHTCLRLQCSPFHANSALRPMIAHLSEAAGLASGNTAHAQMGKLEAQLAIAGIDDCLDCALIAVLLGVPLGERYRVLAIAPPQQLHLTQQALRRYLSGLSAHRPLLVIVEDMHWADPATVQLVSMLLEGGAQPPILLVLTARPGFVAPWEEGGAFISLRLQGLRDSDARAVAAQQSTLAHLPAPWLTSIVERSDGVPLFIEEMARMLLERSAAGVDASVARSVPDTLADLLTERLDRLPPAARLMAQLAAVIGREFDRALLLAAMPDGAAAIQALLDSGLVLPGSADGKHMLFKHALVEDAAYAAIPLRRRAELHRRVADTLLAHFSERIAHQPAMAACHLSRAGDGLGAAPWWQAAGAAALSRGALHEAAGHLRDGVASLAAAVSGPERDQAELGLLSMLGPTTMVLLGPGSAAFGDIQQRSYGLSLSLPTQPQLFSISYGWCLFNWGRARLVIAAQLAETLLDAAAQRPGDSAAAMAAHNMAGMVRFHLGQAREARLHLTHSTALYEPQRDAALYPVYLMDFGVFGRFYLALSAQVLGFADAARGIAAEALQLAKA